MRNFLAPILLCLAALEPQAARGAGGCEPLGKIRWNSSTNQVEGCDGSLWLNLYLGGAATTMSCAGNPVGKISFTGSDVTYCDGSSWVRTQSSASLGPCDRPGKFQFDPALGFFVYCDGTNQLRKMGGTATAIPVPVTVKVAIWNSKTNRCYKGSGTDTEEKDAFDKAVSKARANCNLDTYHGKPVCDTYSNCVLKTTGHCSTMDGSGYCTVP